MFPGERNSSVRKGVRKEWFEGASGGAELTWKLRKKRGGQDSIVKELGIFCRW
jgi:hypothetical protein